MATTRADEVAEILFELKRDGRISTYTEIARRAGFSAGSNGRAMDSAIKVVRRDYPHLHWFRAVKDDGFLEVESEQCKKLQECGYELAAHDDGKRCRVDSFDTHVMVWTAPTGDVAVTEEQAPA